MGSLDSLAMSDPFPEIKSTHSLVAKYVTKPIWDKLSSVKTATSGFTLAQAIACAVEFDNQHCGIYAGDWDSYKVFADVFDPLIQEYHGISADATHTSDMDVNKIKGNVGSDVPVHSVRIRVGRSIQGFGLSPGITKEQRVGVENLMKKAFANLKGDLAGTYFPLTGMDEKVRQQLVDDHFLFVSGDPNLKVAGMERGWPEGRGIFHNKDKTFLVWVNEEDQTRIISMQKGGDVKGVFERLARGIKAVGDSVKAESGKDFQLSEKFGYIHSCPTNLGTGMRASVHVDLPGWTKDSIPALKDRCEVLSVHPVEPVVNLVDKLATLMTFPTSIVLDTPKSALSKPCGKKILYSKRNTECNYFPSYCDLNLFQKDILPSLTNKNSCNHQEIKKKNNEHPKSMRKLY